MKPTPATVALCVVLALACSRHDDRGTPGHSSDAMVNGHGISVVRVATIGADDRTGAIGDMPFSVSRDSRGNVYLGWSGSTGVPVFDSAGKFVRTIGSKGSGPGELLSAANVVAGRGDTIWITDRQNARISAFSADGRFLTARPLPGMLDGLVQLSTGEMVINAVVVGKGAGKRAHVIDTAGNLIRSFVDAGAGGPPDGPERFVFTPDRGTGGLVSAARSRYDIRVWSADGIVSRSVQRSPGWFVIRPPGKFDEGPGASLVGAAQTPDGGFLVVANTPTGGWKTWAAGAALTGDVSIKSMPMDSLFHTTIEHLDQRGDSIGAVTIPAMGLRILENGLVSTYRLLPDGLPIIELWRPRIATGR
jgi:hypothetical protein